MNRFFNLTRREFVQAGAIGSAAAATSLLTPPLSWGAINEQAPADAPSDASGKRILVVIELSGGNDGLNTVTPYGHREYYRARPRIAIDAKQVLKLRQSDRIGLHPELALIKELIDEGAAGIAQGVGHANPTRSHALSKRVWHTGDPASTGHMNKGWLSAALALANPSADVAAQPFLGVAVDREAPLALSGPSSQPWVVQDPQTYRWSGSELNELLGKVYEQLQGPAADASDLPQIPNQTLAYLQRLGGDRRAIAHRLANLSLPDVLTSFPGGRLADRLRVVARLIQAGLPTQVYYVSMSGFDTHARQVDRHAQSLWHFASGVHGFYQELIAMKQQDRVLTMAFSEFGRRVYQNASDGTDHGTAGPVFLFGSTVEPGLINNHPSLSQLDEGDLRHVMDFRSIYTAILNEWWGLDSSVILGAGIKPARIFKKT